MRQLDKSVNLLESQMSQEEQGQQKATQVGTAETTQDNEVAAENPNPNNVGPSP